MGVEGVYLNTDIDSARILDYCYRFKNYINDHSYNRPFITSRLIEPILQNDISLTIDSSFTYVDTHINKEYEISFNTNEPSVFESEKLSLETGSPIYRTVEFINPPFNKKFLTDPSFNIKEYDNQSEIYYLYDQLLYPGEILHKRAYYMIQYVDIFKTKNLIHDLSDNIITTDLSDNVISTDLSDNVISIDLSNNVYYNDYHINVYCNVYKYNDDKLKHNNDIIESMMFYKENVDFSFINSDKFYSNCYDYIKMEIIKKLDDYINNIELFKLLDISSMLINI